MRNLSVVLLIILVLTSCGSGKGNTSTTIADADLYLEVAISPKFVILIPRNKSCPIPGQALYETEVIPQNTAEYKLCMSACKKKETPLIIKPAVSCLERKLVCPPGFEAIGSSNACITEFALSGYECSEVQTEVSINLTKYKLCTL